MSAVMISFCRLALGAVRPRALWFLLSGLLTFSFTWPAFAQATAASSLPAKPLQINATEEIPSPKFVEGDGKKPGPTAEPTNPALATAQATTADAPLEPFGSRLFTGNFLQTRQDGLNPEYVVAPGDRIQVNTWGALESSSVLIVDGQGNVFLPNVGPVSVAGTKNSDLTARMRAGLSRVYSRGFEVYTNLLSAKPVAVFVTGGVKRPGRYAGVPSDSILFFLEQAGGIDPRLGSYRSISVMRGETKLADVDLYDFLLRGTLPRVQFKDGDTVLVNPRGPIVELRGDVSLPASLEFKAGSSTGSEALAVVPGAARATQVTVEGIRNGVPISRTLSVQAFQGFALQDGDGITLRGDGRADTILVRLEGEFNGPSVLAVRRGSRLVDVLNYVSVDPVLANQQAVHIRRASVAKAQKTSIDDALFRLERSALLALCVARRSTHPRQRGRAHAEVRRKSAPDPAARACRHGARESATQHRP
jgi:protein involved in polysaccharide export with SLBB domain